MTEPEPYFQTHEENKHGISINEGKVKDIVQVIAFNMLDDFVLVFLEVL